MQPCGPEPVAPLRTQLLKWVGNKQRSAHVIASWLPRATGTYIEPFLGSGAVLGTLAPPRALGSDVFEPLVGIWRALRDRPDALTGWYRERWELYDASGGRPGYEQVRAAYNRSPNPADLLFLSRACYGGVVRFRRADGHMSTPCGAHAPITPASFDRRVQLWHGRTAGARFERLDYREALARAGRGDVVYCDPPYSDSQAILYGAQDFRLADLFESVAAARARGAFVAVSIDGSKRSGRHVVPLDVPAGLFEQELVVSTGRSMLRRFQLAGGSLEDEVVADRLLLTGSRR